MFSHYSRVLATVPRWAIVPTLRQQSVAEHSYYVSLYVAELLQLPIFDHWDPERKFMALRAALVHDAPEARMSDIPGPVKRQIKDPVKYEQMEHNVFVGMGYVDKHGYPWYSDEEIAALIKAADQIDEYFFLSVDEIMGNRLVSLLRQQSSDRLDFALAKLPWPAHRTQSGPYEVREAIDNSISGFDTGIETLSNNDDVVSAARGGYTADTPECGCTGFDECEKCRIPF